jgi:hypothetical protein
MSYGQMQDFDFFGTKFGYLTVRAGARRFSATTCGGADRFAHGEAVSRVFRRGEERESNSARR